VSTPERTFDAYEDSYRDAVQDSIGFIGQDHTYFMAAKVRHLLRLANTLGDTRGLSALDIGCGTGETDELIGRAFGQLHGIDVSEPVLRTAAETNPHVDYQAYDGERLPFADDSVDLAFAICVIHHVPRMQWFDFAREMGRVVRPGGLVAIFEHNPYNPLTRRAVNNCPFDEEAELLSRRQGVALVGAANAKVVDRRYILFFPFGGRKVAPIEALLRPVPLGAQWLVAGEVR
jgi:SAM-dependent methyltransferase